MAKLFGWLFLIIPWIIIPSDKLADPFRLPKSVFFDLICMGLICFSFYSGLKKRYFNKYLSWLSIWVFFTIFLGFYFPFMMSFNNRQIINIWILEPMIHFILGLWASYIALSCLDNEDYLKISKFVCVSSILISSVGILQVFGLDIFGTIAKYNHAVRICAFLDNPNIVGNYLCLTLPFFLIKENKKFIIGLILGVIGIIFTKSELSIVCGIIGLAIYLLLINRNLILRAIASFACLFSTVILLFNKSLLISFMSDRFTIWQLAWEKFTLNPIFGQGLGIFKTLGITHNGAKALSAHNDWLEIAISIGALGLVLVLLVVINAVRKFNFKTDNKIGFVYFSSFITFLFLMLGSFLLEIAPLALFGLLNWWAVESL